MVSNWKPKPPPEGYKDIPSIYKDTEKHTPESTLYVTDRTRLCPGCPEEDNIHRLRDFVRNISSNRYTVLCRVCLEKERDHHLESKSLVTIGKSLEEAGKTGAISGTALGEILSSICKPSRGPKRLFGKYGRIVKKTMDRALTDEATGNDLDRALKAGSILLASAAAVEKNSKPADTKDYSEEFIIDTSIELMIANKGMRARVLNDTTVRKLLLADLGVDVVDTVDGKVSESEPV